MNPILNIPSSVRKKYAFLLFLISTLITAVIFLKGLQKEPLSSQNLRNMQAQFDNRTAMLNQLRDENKKLKIESDKYKDITLQVQTIQKIVEILCGTLKEQSILACTPSVSHSREYLNAADILFSINKSDYIAGHPKMSAEVLKHYANQIFKIRSMTMQEKGLVISVYKEVKNAQ